jgi:hypothetical protein
VKDELQRVRVPGEEAAAKRSWRVVAAAYATREPDPDRRRRPLVAAVAFILLALAAGALATSPGRAVLDELREVVGVERAQPALFSLPTGVPRGQLVAVRPLRRRRAGPGARRSRAGR